MVDAVFSHTLFYLSPSLRSPHVSSEAAFVLFVSLSVSLSLSLSLYLPFCPSFAFAYIHPSNYQLFIASFRLPFTSVRLCTFACVVCSACARLKIAADRTWTAETSKRFGRVSGREKERGRLWARVSPSDASVCLRH